ncbi:hypothetical protein SAMN00790413_01495 [Deinococcus hopiensis KR-140]|uniref:Uncharacterized protein n=1 Tax=Deinococcus hopiensis KR-140 TaxID=695939 RepID=A0A1W1VFT1_9DEIO|nr:hypothetical protein SAMN00790413_01495 [Deinococcus hopiensis KR-140]
MRLRVGGKTLKVRAGEDTPGINNVTVRVPHTPATAPEPQAPAAVAQCSGPLSQPDLKTLRTPARQPWQEAVGWRNWKLPALTLAWSGTERRQRHLAHLGRP